MKVAPDRVTVTPDSQPLKITTPSQDFRANVTVPDPQAMFVNAATIRSRRRSASRRLPRASRSDPNPTMSSAGSAGTSTLEAPVVAPSVPPPISAPPRAIVFPLVSVIAADGEIHPAERALIDRFLESEGLAPLTEDEFRVHHPSEVAHLVPKERREMVVQLMCETATVDGMPDESERRVIRAYAAAWGVPDEKVEFWMSGYESMSTSLVRQLWMKLRRFVLSARWSDAEQEGR